MMNRFALFAGFSAFMLVSCATNAWAGNDTNATQREIVAWAAMDNSGCCDDVFDEIPEWLQNVIDGEDFVLPEKIQEKIGKNYHIVRVRPAGEGKNPAIAREIAGSINTTLDERYNGILLYDEDAQEVLCESAENAIFDGFDFVKEYRILVYETDLKSAKVRDFYAFVQIYTCERASWLRQAEDYIRTLGFSSGNADLKDAASFAEEIVCSIKPCVIFAEDFDGRSEIDEDD